MSKVNRKESYVVAGPTGIEPAAYGLRVRRSGLTELRARKVTVGKEFSSMNIEVSLSNACPV